MLQRIVKALPYKLLLVQKDSRPFWCFVFLSRCLIYKVHAAVTAGFHCTTFSSLCQELFLSFSANSLSYRVALISDFIRISHPELFVKNFFQLFSKLFLFSPRRPLRRPDQDTTLRTLCQELFSTSRSFHSQLFVSSSFDFPCSLKGLAPRSSACLY